jgi:hypothetical protein
VTDQSSHPILERQAPTSSHVSRVWWCWSHLCCCFKDRDSHPSFRSTSVLVCSFVEICRVFMSSFSERAEDGGSSASCQLRLIFVCLYCAVSSLNRSMCRPACMFFLVDCFQLLLCFNEVLLMRRSVITMA